VKRVEKGKLFSLRSLEFGESAGIPSAMDIKIEEKLKRLEKSGPIQSHNPNPMKPKGLKNSMHPIKIDASAENNTFFPAQPTTPPFKKNEHFVPSKLQAKFRRKKNLSGIKEENTEEIDESLVINDKRREPASKLSQYCRTAPEPPQIKSHVIHMKKTHKDAPLLPMSFIECLVGDLDFSPTTEIKKLVEKIRRDDRDLESLFRVASLILQNSKDLSLFERALLHLQKLNSEYKKKEISFALGKLNFMKGKWDQSLYYLKKNYNYSIKKDKALNYIVKILMKQRNFNKAKVACDKWIELSPGNCRALYIKGKILYREHKFEEALELFVKVVDQNLNHFKALLYLGFIKQVWEESIEDAKVCFEGVVANKFAGSKFKSRAYYGLSVLFQDMNRAMALQYMRSAIKYSSQDWGLKKTLGDMLVKFRKFKKAISVYKSLLSEKEEDLELLFVLGTIYMITSQYFKSMKYFIRVIELSGKILEVRFEGLFANIFGDSSSRQKVRKMTSNYEVSTLVNLTRTRKPIRKTGPRALPCLLSQIK
jgi:tetratricopeptide (TPR) repeat protein